LQDPAQRRGIHRLRRKRQSHRLQSAFRNRLERQRDARVKVKRIVPDRIGRVAQFNRKTGYVGRRALYCDPRFVPTRAERNDTVPGLFSPVPLDVHGRAVHLSPMLLMMKRVRPYEELYIYSFFLRTPSMSPMLAVGTAERDRSVARYHATDPNRHCPSGLSRSTIADLLTSWPTMGRWLADYVKREFEDYLQCGRFGTRLSAGAPRNLPCRASGGVQPQAPWVLPELRGVARGPRSPRCWSTKSSPSSRCANRC
jgi:hypothetical protein